MRTSSKNPKLECKNPKPETRYGPRDTRRGCRRSEMEISRIAQSRIKLEPAFPTRHLPLAPPSLFRILRFFDHLNLFRISDFLLLFSSHYMRSLADWPTSISNEATKDVQPVWWLAPTPAPVSPLKYSWNGM
jgi:hypothetical protein